jgi:flagellin FlaB
MQRTPDALNRARDERGITGLETAIVLIAFVVVAAVFAFTVLSTGLFASERGKDTVFAGLAKTRGTLQVVGGVLATSDQTEVTNLKIEVVLGAGGGTVNLDPSSTSNQTTITYIDSATRVAELTYTTTAITGNANSVLEQGELLEISISGFAAAGIHITENSKFTLEIKPATGSYMLLQRTMPSSMSDTIINLN